MDGGTGFTIKRASGNLLLKFCLRELSCLASAFVGEHAVRIGEHAVAE